ncbi:MAG: hypothetical protein ACOCV4_08855 [Myxococcota bacterium]
MTAPDRRPPWTRPGLALLSVALFASGLALGCGDDGEAGSGEAITTRIDIRPGSCPNPLSCEDDGTLPVTITDASGLDIEGIDPESVLLEGVAPVDWRYEDVAAPYFPEDGTLDDCEEACWTRGADGIADLSLEFETQELIAALDENRGVLLDGSCMTLHLTGRMTDEAGGTVFEAWDSVRFTCD